MILWILCIIHRVKRIYWSIYPFYTIKWDSHKTDIYWTIYPDYNPCTNIIHRRKIVHKTDILTNISVLSNSAKLSNCVLLLCLTKSVLWTHTLLVYPFYPMHNVSTWVVIRITTHVLVYQYNILKVCGTTGCCFTPWSVNSVDEGEGVYVKGPSDLGECNQYDVNDGSQNNEIGIYFQRLRLNLNFKSKLKLGILQGVP